VAPKAPSKQCSDAGENLFNSESKCQFACSPFFVFGKLLRQQNPDQPCPKKGFEAAWVVASPHAKEHCQCLAKEWIDQEPLLLEELQKVLQSTRGSVSWVLLAALVPGSGNLQLASGRAARGHVMALPESTHKSTKLLPKLDEANIQWHLWWPHQLWAFWRSATHFEAVQALLVHMGKKWLWSTAVCTHLKCIPFLGTEPAQHGMQHKSHLGKVVGIASAAFAPKGNDAEAGGQASPVNLVWVGKMTPAKKDAC